MEIIGTAEKGWKKRGEGDMRKEDRKEDDDRVREKDNRKEERMREKDDRKEERMREKDDRKEGEEREKGDRKEDEVREKDDRKEERMREKDDRKEGEEREKDDRIRAGSLGLRNRTGRTAQDKMCQKCKEGEFENEQHVVLKCPAYRVERNRMLGKVRRIWGEERWVVWMGREEGEQLKEIVSLFGDPSEVLARMVGEGVRKMMKEREG